ncbi:phage head-tail connector protein [Gemella sp. 19428wG2_WT2a]|nr:phage head-tail connector protein [Gemella sp. 19428wG2_WT2a]TFU57685.1 DNA-packaging protein [Gemella sp. WT2a]
MENTQLEKIKRRLGIDLDNDNENDLLKDLINDAESYFLGFTGALTIEDKYQFMIENVVYKLYGQKGSEALASENIDGYSVTYHNLNNLFEPYLEILKKDFKLESEGGIQFL